MPREVEPWEGVKETASYGFVCPLLKMCIRDSYEGMSIAEFNRTINRIMEDDEYGGGSIYELYDTCLLYTSRCV